MDGASVMLLGARLDVGNMGCRALAASLVTLLTRQLPGGRLTLFYGHPKSDPQEVRIEAGRTATVGMINYRMSPRACHREHLLWLLLMAVAYRAVPSVGFRGRLLRRYQRLAAIRSADVVADIHGGDSFSDIYGVRRFLLNITPSVLALLLERPLVLLPQTYGPYQSWLARRIARSLMRRAVVVLSRDAEGLRVVQELSGARKSVLCPDVAFCLEPLRPAVLQVDPPLSFDGGKPVVAVNVSGLLHMGGYTRDNMFGLKGDYPRFVASLIERFIRDTEAEVLLIPHVMGEGVESDVRACEEVHSALGSRFGGRLHVLRGHHDQSELKWIIGRCQFLVGSRMHACIAAISQAVPCVGVAYSRKFVGVFETAGVGDAVVDARSLPVERMVELCLQHWERRGRTAEHLRQTVPGVRTLLETTFREQVSDRAQLAANAGGGSGSAVVG